MSKHATPGPFQQPFEIISVGIGLMLLINLGLWPFFSLGAWVALIILAAYHPPWIDSWIGMLAFLAGIGLALSGLWVFVPGQPCCEYSLPVLP